MTFDIGCSNAAVELRPYGNLTFRQSPRPGERAKCSAWAICLGYRATAIEPGTNHLMQTPAKVNIAGSHPLADFALSDPPVNPPIPAGLRPPYRARPGFAPNPA